MIFTDLGWRAWGLMASFGGLRPTDGQFLKFFNLFWKFFKIWSAIGWNSRDSRLSAFLYFLLKRSEGVVAATERWSIFRLISFWATMTKSVENSVDFGRRSCTSRTRRCAQATVGHFLAGSWKSPRFLLCQDFYRLAFDDSVGWSVHNQIYLLQDRFEGLQMATEVQSFLERSKWPHSPAMVLGQRTKWLTFWPLRGPTQPGIPLLGLKWDKMDALFGQKWDPGWGRNLGRLL